MSNKSFLVLISVIFSPFAIIWVAEKVDVWFALLLFALVVFSVSGHFRRTKDL